MALLILYLETNTRAHSSFSHAIRSLDFCLCDPLRDAKMKCLAPWLIPPGSPTKGYNTSSRKTLTPVEGGCDLELLIVPRHHDHPVHVFTGLHDA